MGMTMGRWRRAAATAMVVLSLAGPAQAQVMPESLPAVRMSLAQPHVLRDAAARPQTALQMTGRRYGRRPNSSATKTTAAVAMGIVGFFAGAAIGYMAMSGLGVGSPEAVLVSGIGGAAGGAFLGYKLASK